MKILYYADNYTWNIYGTKRSTAEALEDLGHEVAYGDRTKIEQLPEEIARFDPDQIWLFHSDLRLPEGMKATISRPVIGFGISDPYYFSTDRFESYDVYVTYNKDTFNEVRSLIPTVYNRTACDFKFHRNLGLTKACDATIIGNGLHNRFTQKDMRIAYTQQLRIKSGKTIYAFGPNWPVHKNLLSTFISRFKKPAKQVHRDNFPFIDGDDFLKAINFGRLGLDVQDSFSPLAHRMFEYGACGVPVISRRRDEVFDCFEDGKEILLYDSLEEFLDIADWHMNHPDILAAIGRRAFERCKKEHDIHHRVPALVDSINALLK